jgi:acetolactate synthase I/II/III large subunit
MAFLEKTNIPAACTLLGLSAVPTNHSLYVGMLGMHGNYAPNINTNEADLIIAIGMRFDDRVTSDTASYARNAKVIHMDIDLSEFNKNVHADVSIAGDVKQTLPIAYQRSDSKRAFGMAEHFPCPACSGRRKGHS